MKTVYVTKEEWDKMQPQGNPVPLDPGQPPIDLTAWGVFDTEVILEGSSMDKRLRN